MRAYNKSYISNTMGIVVVGMDSEYSLENCVYDINIYFQRSQSEKVRQRKIVGKNGVIIKKKGEIHYVDCNVTGSNHGTPKDTKFQLEMLFENFPSKVIDKLVCGGGTLERFYPVIQDVNAGIYQDEKLYKYVVNFCKAKKNGCGNVRDLRCHIYECTGS